jgi:hypothetical protein
VLNFDIFDVLIAASAAEFPVPIKEVPIDVPDENPLDLRSADE